jgi:hypothetical protein
LMMVTAIVLARPPTVGVNLERKSAGLDKVYALKEQIAKKMIVHMSKLDLLITLIRHAMKICTGVDINTVTIGSAMVCYDPDETLLEALSAEIRHTSRKH